MTSPPAAAQQLLWPEGAFRPVRTAQVGPGRRFRPLGGGLGVRRLWRCLRGGARFGRGVGDAQDAFNSRQAPIDVGHRGMDGVNPGTQPVLPVQDQGVWGAMERKVRLATAVSGVSERPELATSDRFRYGERVASQQVDVLVAER